MKKFLAALLLASLTPVLATAADAHRSTGQKIAEKLREQGLSKDAAIVAISTLPIVELRGAIPVGHVLFPDTDKTTRLGRDDLQRAGRIHLLRDRAGQVWVGGQSVSCIVGHVGL